MAEPVTWVVVADAGRAAVYETNTRNLAGEWTQRHSLSARLPASRDIDSDKPGRSFDSGGQGRHAIEPPTDPHRHAKHNFAHDVVGVLDDARRRGELDDLVVVAEPRFLGDLRSLMPDQLRSRVRHEVGKDYSKLSEAELRDRVRGSL